MGDYLDNPDGNFGGGYGPFTNGLLGSGSGAESPRQQKWMDALNIIGSMLRDIGSKGRTNDLAATSQGINARRAQDRQNQGYQDAISQIFGAPQALTQVPITPKVPMMNATPNSYSAPGVQMPPSQVQNPNATPGDVNAYQAAHQQLQQVAQQPAISYSGGMMPSGAADKIAPLLAAMGPRQGFPMLTNILQQQMQANQPMKLAEKDRLIQRDPNSPAGYKTLVDAVPTPSREALVPRQGINPATGKPDQFLVGQDMKPVWLNIAPDSKQGAAGDLVIRDSDGNLIPNTVAINARAQVARAEELAKQGITGRTETQIKAQLADKVARGVPLDPNEQKAASLLFPQAPAFGADNSDPVVKSYVQSLLNGTIQSRSIPAQYRNAVMLSLNGSGPDAFTPQAKLQQTSTAKAILAPYMDLPGYKLTANALPYLGKIDTAMKFPGSVSDQDLLDSLTKINTAGNAITDAQVRIITGGRSFADAMNVFANKFQNGGELSDNQRKQIQDIAHGIYDNYQKGFKPIYDAASKQLEAANIHKSFWPLPDLNNLAEQTLAAQSQANTARVPQVAAANPAAVAPPMQAATSAPQTATPAPVAHPATIPPGSLYSPSRRQYKTPDGKILDATGNPVQ